MINKKIILTIFFSIIPLFFFPWIKKRLLFCFLIFLFFGYFSKSKNEKFVNSVNFNITKVSSFEGDIISLKEKPFENDVILNVRKIFINGSPYKWSGKIIIKTKGKKFREGEKLRVKNIKIEEIPSPQNPFEFDYKNFLKKQGILFQVRSEEIEVISENMNFKLFFFILKERIEKRIEKYMKFNPDGCELVKLLTIGSDNIPDFLRKTGVMTGIYHLFVISGLHIGFLIFLLKILFIPFQKINNEKPFLFPLILSVFLWFYNFLCGFKVPITRAVMMVSFYLISEIFGREISPFQSLIFACIFLLLLNPFYIYSLSFLLSFISTAGILILYKRISKYLRKNFLINSFIATISAQIFVFPILFYNFGYFYPLGILNNLIFTPFVGIITIFSL
ncbi:MAG: ComEC/Rec2 family competence protein, partial [Candidatus Ratteibacteria bacterium]